MSDQLPLLPIGPHDHPDVHTMVWSESELRAIRKYAEMCVAAERERHACWFALVMNAAAALEDAANCLRDQDAKRAVEGAAKHYRTAANAMWVKCVGPKAVTTEADWTLQTR